LRICRKIQTTISLRTKGSRKILKKPTVTPGMAITTQIRVCSNNKIFGMLSC
jgi:hypothetical protein